MARMTIASYGIGVSRSKIQAMNETTVATSSSSVSGSWNWARKRRQAGVGGSAGSSFRPYCSSLAGPRRH